MEINEILLALFQKGKEMKVIMTCFAGRQSCMPLLIKQVKSLISKKLVDEFHIWNYTKKVEDDHWLTKEFGGTSIKGMSIIQKELTGYSYVNSGLTVKTNEMVVLRVKAAGDALLLLRSKVTGVIYEVCIGGWNNSRSVVRNGIQGGEIASLHGRLLKENEFVEVKIGIGEGHLEVRVGEQEVAMLVPLMETRSDGGGIGRIDLFDIHVSGWNNHKVVVWQYEDPFDFGHSVNSWGGCQIKFMCPKFKRVEKRWDEYYKHYNEARYPHHVIIKVDDDIVFIDETRFKEFINHRILDREHLLLFPSIINNELCAYYQQLHDLIPVDKIGKMLYQPKGFGELWKNGKVTQSLHEFFVKGCDDWLKASEGLGIQDIKLKDRISINFFAVLSKDLHVFQMVYWDDERELTEILPDVLKKPIGIDMSFCVSHLAFYKQRETGLDVDEVYKWYCELVAGREEAESDSNIMKWV